MGRGEGQTSPEMVAMAPGMNQQAAAAAAAAAATRNSSVASRLLARSLETALKRL